MTRTTTNSTPKRGRPFGTFEADSRVSRLCELEVGSCESASRRIPMNEATGEARREIKEQLSSSMRAAVSRATNRCDSQYTVETGEFQTSSDHWIISAVATRIK